MNFFTKQFGLLVVLAVIIPMGARAGMFVWSPPVPVTTADRSLDLPGTIVGAEVFGLTEKIVMLADNTAIDFKTDGSVATIVNTTVPNGSGMTNGAFAGSTGNGDFDSVLDQFSYDGGPKTITLYNLTVGERYSVQMFALDDRDTGRAENLRPASFQDPKDAGNVSASFEMGDNVFVLGKFTAPDPGDGSTTVNVSIRENLPTGGNGNINTLVVRALGKHTTPQITTQPQSVTIYAGGIAKFTVVSIGKAPSCQWQKKMDDGKFMDISDGGNVSGARTPSLVVSNLTATDASEYRVVLANAAGTVTSVAAQLVVFALPSHPPPGSLAEAMLANQPVAYWQFCEPADTTLIYDFAGSHCLVNHDVGLGGPGFSVTNRAGFFNGQSSAAVSGASLMNGFTNFSVLGWFSPAGAQNGSRVGLFGQNNAFELGYNDMDGLNLFLSVANSPEILKLNTGTNGFHAGQWYFVAVVADGYGVDIYVNGLRRAHQANTGLPVVNSTYGFNIGGGGVLDPTGNYFYGQIEDVAVFRQALAGETIQNLFRMGVGAIAPAIVMQPESQVQSLGGSAQFFVTAEGTPPLHYQWQVSAAVAGGFVNLSDADGFFGTGTAGLTVTNITLKKVDSYRVVVSNAVGVAVSAVVSLSALSATPQFVWSAPVPITTAEATLNLSGKIVGAEVFGAEEKTVTLSNGTNILFQTNGTVATVTNGSFVWGGSGTTNGAFSGSTGNRDFDAVLTQFNYDGGPKTITLHNLVAGRKYSVQLFALDDRIGLPGSRKVSFQDPDDASDISATFTMADDAYVVGMFTATNADMVIRENLPLKGGGNINALVVRDLGVSASSPPSSKP